jgi:hypothetical protein
VASWKRGYSPTKAGRWFLRLILSELAKSDMELVVVWISTTINIADVATRPEEYKDNDEIAERNKETLKALQRGEVNTHLLSHKIALDLSEDVDAEKAWRQVSELCEPETEESECVRDSCTQNCTELSRV